MAVNAKRAIRKRKGPMKVKRSMKVKGPTEVNFKQGGGQTFFSIASLANLSPALPLSK